MSFRHLIALSILLITTSVHGLNEFSPNVPYKAGDNCANMFFSSVKNPSEAESLIIKILDANNIPHLKKPQISEGTKLIIVPIIDEMLLDVTQQHSTIFNINLDLHNWNPVHIDHHSEDNTSKPILRDKDRQIKFSSGLLGTGFGTFVIASLANLAPEHATYVLVPTTILAIVSMLDLARADLINYFKQKLDWFDNYIKDPLEQKTNDQDETQTTIMIVLISKNEIPTLNRMITKLKREDKRFHPHNPEFFYYNYL